MKELPRRSLTAAVFVLVVLGSILADRHSFYALMLLVQGGCLYEYLRLIAPFQAYAPSVRRILHLLAVLLACGWHLSIWWADSQNDFFTTWLLLLPAVLLLLLAEVALTGTLQVRSLFRLVAGIVGISWTLYHSYLLTLPEQELWRPWPALLLVSVVLMIWATDTVAYFAGHWWGRHKLAPAVSPNKTWEGFFGGIAGAMLCALLLFLLLKHYAFYEWMLLALVVSLTAPLGDLAESWLKRKTGVKDSGTLLPGHGGLLDRFDGWLTAMPAAAYFALWISG